MKGAIEPDHILTNRYQFDVAGVLKFQPTEVSEITDETLMTELPDRTRASGGEKKASELTFKVPAHHLTVIAALEAWRSEAVELVTPGYKKTVIYTMSSGTGERLMVRNLFGCWLGKRTDPAAQMSGDGDMAVIEYTMHIDDVGLV